MLGQIKLEQFEAMENMPQKYQSAWDGANLSTLTGAKYRPLLCAGQQTVHGTNYFYIAEQTLSDVAGTRRLVLLPINECDGEYFLNAKAFKVILG